MKDKILVVVIANIGYVETYQNTILLIKKYVGVKITRIVKLLHIRQSYIAQIMPKSSLNSLLNHKTSIVGNSKLIGGN